MQTEKKLNEVPSSTVIVEIAGKAYTTSPLNFGLFRSIEREKSRLALGDYHSLAKRIDDSGFYNKVMIDAIASFIVLCPQLLKDLNYERLEDMSLVHSGVLYRVYLNQYLPWYSKWLDYLAANDLVVEKAEEANGTSADSE
jgi:hypothetical protein